MKKSKTPKIKVTPTNVVTGAKAPYFIIDGDIKDANNLKNAIAEAMNNSNLSNSERFTFKTEKV
jgi:hypothetical protein